MYGAIVLETLRLGWSADTADNSDLGEEVPQYFVLGGLQVLRPFLPTTFGNLVLERLQSLVHEGCNDLQLGQFFGRWCRWFHLAWLRLI